MSWPFSDLVPSMEVRVGANDRDNKVEVSHKDDKNNRSFERSLIWGVDEPFRSTHPTNGGGACITSIYANIGENIGQVGEEVSYIGEEKLSRHL